MRERATYGAMARAGYAARGVVYLIIGGFALLAAFGTGDRPTGKKGALEALLAQPFGDALLGLVGVGLLGFAGWRLFQALLDADHYGREPKALVRRAAYVVSAAVYAGLAFWAFRAALGSDPQDGGGDRAAHDWTAWLLAQPFGRWLVGAVGLIIIGTGIAIGLRGWKATFERRLQLESEARRWVVPLGRFGMIARGVVFVMIGAFLIVAAVHFNSGEARGLGGALRTLQQQPYGWILLGVTALGLFAFGVFEFVQAAYRRIDPPSLRDAAAHAGLR